MPNTSKNRQNILENTADVTAMRLFFVLAFLLLSCSGVFGQATIDNVEAQSIVIENVSVQPSSDVVAEASTTTAQMELVIWLMGSKQATSTNDASKSSTATTTKKQLINCGMTPNRLLSRTLLKKAMQYEANVA